MGLGIFLSIVGTAKFVALRVWILNLHQGIPLVVLTFGALPGIRGSVVAQT